MAPITKLTKEQIDANTYSDMIMIVNPSSDRRNATDDTSLNRNISNGQSFQTILRMYAEEMQSACEREKSTSFSPRKNECYISSIENVSENSYLNNSLHISDVVHSNDIMMMMMKRVQKVGEKNGENQRGQTLVSSVCLDNQLSPKDSLKSFEPSYVNYDKCISTQSSESNLLFENGTGTDEKKNVTCTARSSKENMDSNYYDVSQENSQIREKKDDAYYTLVEKKENLEHIYSSHENCQFSTKSFSSNEQNAIYPLTALDTKGFNESYEPYNNNNNNNNTNNNNNILRRCPFNYTPIDLLKNCYNPCNVIISSDTIKDHPYVQDIQLDYSSASSIDINRKDTTYDSNVLNTNTMHSLSKNISKEKENSVILLNKHKEEMIKENSLNRLHEKCNIISSEKFNNLKENKIREEQKSTGNENAEEKIQLTLNKMFYEEFCERNQKKEERKEKEKEKEIDFMNNKYINENNKIKEENFKIEKKNVTDAIIPTAEQIKNTEKKKKKNHSDIIPKRYKLEDMKNGKIPIPQTIFKPLPLNTSEPNLINAYEKNRKLQKFMNECNNSVHLILKYPKIQNKKTKKENAKTLFMPISYSSLNENIGIPIIYEDDFDRYKHEPNVTNLHMGSIFEKHVFNMLKNKKNLGKNIFIKSNKFSKYSYQNGNGFWMSNIDKNRLHNCPLEKNNSYITELIYEKGKSFKEEMELLKSCPNYDTIVPSLDELYKNNNFYNFLSKEKLYKRNTQPDIATIMRKYDIEGISDYKIARHAFGITPIYSEI